ncbi:Uncharacterized protein FKW44_014141 [Caligus rogercresseyi]|uniref:Uncharacterized protein n=1 Tax=Caligus rogercresseyi TaxID=217165 RepID=A0A7T8GYG1_CALRO|nr:Uncharacterized protein FKW44_014141 [Caligus rogercresseyi]
MIGAAARYSALSLKIPKVQNRGWNCVTELIKYVPSTSPHLATTLNVLFRQYENTKNERL